MINPAGIVFGENARLDIGGSFLGSTAESLLFEDGFNYSAIDSEQAPLLSVSVPLGLQYGANPSPINVSGANLAVNSGKTLALAGGDITITNGNLTTEQGRVEIGSVNSPGLVSLTPTSDGFTLGYEGIENFGDISLNQNTVVEVSGEGAGNINLQGRAINILDDSQLIANTSGAQDGGSIVIKASESVEFFGSAIESLVLGGATGRGADVRIETDLLRIADEAVIYLATSSTSDTGSVIIKATDLIMTDASGIYTYIEPDGTGNGGDINLEVEQLELRNASQIGSGVFGAGNGSNIQVKATSIDASGETADGLFTSLILSIVIAGGTGDAGDISVETEDIGLREGAQIFTGTFGEGNAGNINIKANSIELIGDSPTFGFNSSILASAIQAIPDVTVNAGQGDLRGASGNINIETGTLQIRDGGGISSSTESFGDAANINIQATEVEVIGTNSSNENISIITTSSFSSGNGGDIELNVERLSVQNGGQILANALDVGNAGNITVTANDVEVRGTSADGTIFSDINASSEGDGAAGLITITADDLMIADLGKITVSSTGLGNAGNLNVTADSIKLDNQGSLQAEVAAGEQGNINLNSQFLLLRNSSNITTNASGTASGGNITINSPVIAGFENSDIIANAVEGMGGNIDITTLGIFGLEFRSSLTVESDITASSEFGVNGTVEINNFGIDPSSGLVELPVTLADSSQQIATGCSSNDDSSFVATGRGGIPHNPNQYLNLNLTWSDLRDFSAFRKQTNNVTAVTNISNKPNIVEATGFIRNENGEIELVASGATSLRTKQVAECSGTNM